MIVAHRPLLVVALQRQLAGHHLAKLREVCLVADVVVGVAVVVTLVIQAVLRPLVCAADVAAEPLVFVDDDAGTPVVRVA